MTIFAVIAGADDFVGITRVVHSKQDWFAKFIDMSEGVPSHDRFNAIMTAIKPDEFADALLEWMTELHEITDGQNDCDRWQNAST